MTRRGAIVAAVALSLSSTPVRAQTKALVVTGLGGEETYHQLFMSLGDRLTAALHSRFSLPDGNIDWLGEDSTNTKSTYYRGRSTAENIRGEIDRIVRRSKPGDQVLIVLIGHGSGDREDTKFNIPGPDLTANDFKAILDRFSAQRVAFLDLTTASGDAIAVLSGPNRIVVTSTKSAYERNESQFARFFVDALTKPGADVDKDGRVSLLEAYRYAATETRRSYANDERLMTEHAQLDDDGDGKGTDLPDGRGAGDGLMSRRFYIDAGAVEARLAASDPQLAKLYAEKFAAEDRIDALKLRKASMAEDAYYAELETLLVTLARAAREIRRMEGR